MSSRFDSDDDAYGSESFDSGDEYDEDLCKDEDDRAWLDSLPDVERENIIYERSEQRKERLERARIRKQNRGEKEPPKSTPSKSDRSSLRREVVTKKSGEQKRNEILEEMKVRRQVAKTSKAKRDNYGTDEEGEDQERYRKVEEEEYNKAPVAVRQLTLEDLKRVIISRGKLEKWYGEPYFSKDVIGLFVKVSYSPNSSFKQYRLVEILGLEETTSTYSLGNKDCNHLLLVKPNGEQVRKFELRFVSNEVVTEDEFQMWFKQASKNGEVPEEAEIKDLQQKIHHADNYMYTDDDIQRNIELNRKKNPNAVSHTQEKARLLLLIADELQSGGSRDRIDELQRQVDEIIEKERERVNLKVKGKVNMADVNKRNQRENFLKMEKSRTQRQDLTSDIFKRRETRPGLAWLEKSQKKRGPEPQILEDEESTPKKQKKEDPSPPVQPNPQTVKGALDNFDIEIDEILPVNIKKQSTLKPFSSGPRSLPPGGKTMSFADYKKQKQ